MHHILLESQSEAVKQFFLKLPADPQGSVIEFKGEVVACVVPPPKPTNGKAVDDGKWTDGKNQRRCELIDRKYNQGLTPGEEAELAVLQTAMHRYVDKIAPLPIEPLRKLHQELLAKAAKAHVGSKK
ncbi:MAG TPA: hypothetical protein VE988_30610 [Gemmataceae bacterium]|nr:hypothetical protein [Gemmataceae bacterium]